MAKYKAIEEIKSESHVGLWMYAFDFFFIIIYFGISWLIRGMVASNLRTLFMVYSFACGIVLTIPSPFNKKRRMYKSIFIFLHKDNTVYHPITGKEKE